jgi:hypothetical protein
MSYYLFVYTEHPAHNLGGCNDCLGIFASQDAALKAGNTHLLNLWAMPNELSVGNIDILDVSTGAFSRYKRYRHEASYFYSHTTVLADFTKGQDDCPY